MADEGVADATIAEFRAHPYWIVGGIAAVVLLFWYISSSSGSSSAPQQFTFSSGPSDTQIAAQTSLAIQQSNAQEATSVAQINATSAGQIAQSYYGYLATNSNNTLSGQLGVANDQLSSAEAGYSSAQAIAGITANANTNIAALQYGSANTIAATNATAATTIANTNGATQLALAQGANQTQIATQGNASQTQITLASIAAGVAGSAGGSSSSPAPSTSNTAGYIASLYQSLLGRTPDAGGLAYWTQAVTSGQDTLAQVYGSLANSPEAITDQSIGGSATPSSANLNTGFISSLYQQLLGRQPDASGLAYWSGQLNTGAQSQAQVYQDFTSSPERINDVATGTFAA